MDICFSNLNELYTRLLPALRIKKKELNKKFKTNITEKDIWNYLKNIKWTKSIGLSLSVMVDDILKLDNLEIVNNNQEIL